MGKYGGGRKGAAEDWMDDEHSSMRSLKSQTRKKKKGIGEKEALSLEEGNATVSEVYKNQCRVVTDDGKEPLCAYRRTQVWAQANSRNELKERSPVAVGDRVKISRITDRDGIVEGVCERKNQLARPAPDREEEAIHVIVANLDCLVIVVSAKNPEFSPGIVDRFLVAEVRQGIPVVIAVTKTDLLAPDDDRPWELYRQLGYDVHEIATKRHEGVEKLRASLDGKHIAFCGHSGVGKTSLLSALTATTVGQVADVNEFTGKGRHTTSSARIIRTDQNNFWVDTPGVREFGLIGVTPENLKEHFPEMANLPCEASGCLHEEEAGCAARTLPRYVGYARILASLREDGAV